MRRRKNHGVTNAIADFIYESIEIVEKKEEEEKIFEIVLYKITINFRGCLSSTPVGKNKFLINAIVI